MQITFSEHAGVVPVREWSTQLGWEGGLVAEPSWGFEFGLNDFRRVVEAALAEGVASRFPEPRWVGYWSFPIRDPMGNTVEITAVENEAWV